MAQTSRSAPSQVPTHRRAASLPHKVRMAGLSDRGSRLLTGPQTCCCAAGSSSGSASWDLPAVPASSLKPLGSLASLRAQVAGSDCRWLHSSPSLQQQQQAHQQEVQQAPGRLLSHSQVPGCAAAANLPGFKRTRCS